MVLPPEKVCIYGQNFGLLSQIKMYLFTILGSNLLHFVSDLLAVVAFITSGRTVSQHCRSTEICSLLGTPFVYYTSYAEISASVDVFFIN